MTTTGTAIANTTSSSSSSSNSSGGVLTRTVADGAKLTLTEAGFAYSTQSNLTKGGRSTNANNNNNNNGYNGAIADLVSWSDVIGCHCERLPTVSSLTVFAYPRHRRTGRRERRAMRLAIGSFAEAKECQLTVLAGLRRLLPGDPAAPMTWPKPCLILLNPRSGSGKAYDLFLRQVNPILAEADFPYQLVVTRSLDHVRELATAVPLNSVAGIVIVSGDGLVYEVVNSLMARPDAEAALEAIPIGIIPAGSGNAAVSSLLTHLGEFNPDCLLRHAALALVKHRPDSLIPLDVAEVQTPARMSDPLHCVLSITWGLIADVDAESERFRALGGARFGVVIAKKCLAGIRRYRARLSYCPPESEPPERLPGFDEPVPHGWTVLEREFYTIGALLMSHLAEDFCPVTDWQPDDGLFRLFCVYPCSRGQFLRGFTSAAKGRLDDGCMELIRARAFRLEPLGGGGGGGHMMIDGEALEYGPVQARVLPRRARVLLSRQ